MDEKKELVEKQLQENINLFKKESERLTKELDNIKAKKEQIISGKQAISKLVTENQSLKKDIIQEISKLSSVISKISTPIGSPSSSPLPPPGMSPPLGKKPPSSFTVKNSKEKTEKKDAKEEKKDGKEDMLEELRAKASNLTLKSASERNVNSFQKVPRKTNIELKKDELTRLIGKLQRQAAQLSTEKRTFDNLQELVKNQAEVVANLQKLKSNLRQNLEQVTNKVSATLEKINPEPIAKESSTGNTTAANEPPKATGGPPPPPFPPGGVKVVKKSPSTPSTSPANLNTTEDQDKLSKKIRGNINPDLLNEIKNAPRKVPDIVKTYLEERLLDMLKVADDALRDIEEQPHWDENFAENFQNSADKALFKRLLTQESNNFVNLLKNYDRERNESITKDPKSNLNYEINKRRPGFRPAYQERIAKDVVSIFTKELLADSELRAFVANLKQDYDQKMQQEEQRREKDAAEARARREVEQKEKQEKEQKNQHDKAEELGVKYDVINEQSLIESQNHLKKNQEELNHNKTIINTLDIFLKDINKNLYAAIEKAETAHANMPQTPSNKVSAPLELAQGNVKEIIADATESNFVEIEAENGNSREDIIGMDPNDTTSGSEELDDAPVDKANKSEASSQGAKQIGERNNEVTFFQKNSDSLTPSQKRQLLDVSGYNEALKNLYEKKNKLHSRNYRSATSEITIIYDNLIRERDNFLEGKLNLEDFIKKSSEQVNNKTNHLAEHRNIFSRIFNNILEVFGGKRSKTDSLIKIENVKNKLDELEKKFNKGEFSIKRPNN